MPHGPRGYAWPLTCPRKYTSKDFLRLGQGLSGTVAGTVEVSEAKVGARQRKRVRYSKGEAVEASVELVVVVVVVGRYICISK